MNKKKWVLVVLLLLTVLGWYKLFYKTYSISAVAQSADAIVAIDVKRITNTVIWQFITTPSQWKISRNSSSKDTAINWKDVIELPDYILAFHIKNQPYNIWYTKFKLKNKSSFEKALKQYQFIPIGANEYTNEEMDISIYINNGEVLLSTTTTQNKEFTQLVIDELFTQKKYSSKETIRKLVNAKSHVALLFTPNIFLNEDAIVNLNFDKEKINISSIFTPKPMYTFKESTFEFSSNSLLSMYFTQPNRTTYSLLDNTSKEKISKVLNFSTDSIFLLSNKNYFLTLTNFTNRVDSAITYTYDDEFNKIEKVVTNNVQEPLYKFSITGDSVNKIYTYWKKLKVIEQTANGNLFTALPFVKSYCTINENKVEIKPTTYKEVETNSSFKGIFYLQVLVANIPKNLLNYMPEPIKNSINNIADIKLTAQNKKNTIEVNGIIQKKKNDLPILKF